MSVHKHRLKLRALVRKLETRSYRYLHLGDCVLYALPATETDPDLLTGTWIRLPNWIGKVLIRKFEVGLSQRDRKASIHLTPESARHSEPWSWLRRKLRANFRHRGVDREHLDAFVHFYMEYLFEHVEHSSAQQRRNGPRWTWLLPPKGTAQ